MAVRGSGRLYVVATPIGNLSDITQRAVKILKSVPIVACEDTRRAGKLLAHVGASPDRLVTLHDHNEITSGTALINSLRTGDNVALISDAGTPLISDPGFKLVRAAWDAHIAVCPVPGVSAVTAAIASSPIPVDRFRFEGFLPAKSMARKETLARLLTSDIAVVFFEAPHRMRATLADIAELGGQSRQLLVCRELTKRYETISFNTVEKLLKSRVVLDKGEFSCILSPAESIPAPASVELVIEVLAEELPTGQAARLAAKITGWPRRDLYERVVSIHGARG